MRTVSSSTYSVQITKPECGGGHCCQCLTFLNQTATDGSRDLYWIHGQVAPDAVLELLACQCKRKCVPDDCPCMVNGFKCTYMCRLQTCENQKVEDETFENDSDVDCDTDED